MVACTLNEVIGQVKEQQTGTTQMWQHMANHDVKQLMQPGHECIGIYPSVETTQQPIKERMCIESIVYSNLHDCVVIVDKTQLRQLFMLTGWSIVAMPSVDQRTSGHSADK